MFKLILLILQISKSTRDSILKDSYRIDPEFFFSLNNPIVISILLTIIIFAVTIIFFKYIIIPMNKKHFDHEQSLKFEHSRLMALFTELDPNPVFRFDTEGKITMANKVGLEIFGSNFLYESKLSQIIPELKEFDLNSLISEGKKFNIDTKIKDRYLQFTICGILELKIGQIYGTDITERKILEMELSDSEKRYRTLVETSPDAIVVTDLKGNIITINQSGLELLDCEKIEDVFGKNFIDFIIHKERIQAAEDFQKIIQVGHVKDVSYNLLKKDGTSISVELNTSLIFDSSKRPSALICVARDITERKLTEEILWKSEEKYRNLYEAIDQGTALCEVLTDKNGKPVDYMFLDINNKYTMLTGLTRKMVKGKRALEINPQIEQYRIDTLGDVALTGKSIYYEDYFPQNDKYYSVYAYCPIKNQFAVLISDITERKQAEEAIRESEERFTAFMNNSPAVAWMKDPATWTFSYINNTFEKIFDITREVISKKTDFDLWPEEVARQLRENDLNVMSSGKTIQTYEDVPLPDGTVHNWLVFKFPLHTPSGKRFLAGIAVDITERKRAEESLKESEERLRIIAETTHAALYRLKYGAMKYDYMNPAIESLTGYNPDEINKIGFAEIILKIESSGGKELSSDKLKSNREDEHVNEFVADYLIRTKEGDLKWLADRSYPWFDEKRILIGSLGILTDITQRKESEQEIIAQRNKFEQLFGNSPVAIALLDDQDRITLINNSFSSLFGYTIDETVGKNLNDLVVPPEFKDEGYSIPSVTHDGESIKKESFRRKKDGSLVFVQIAGIPVIVDGKTIAIYVMYVDLSERKKAEEEISMLAHSLRSVNECVSITDMEDRIVFVNQSFLNTYGYTEEELIGKHISIVRLPKEILPATLRGGWTGELWNKRKDGSEFPIYLSTTVINDKKGKLLGLIRVAKDITERKLLEKKLINSKEQLRALASRLQNVREEEKLNLSRELHDNVGQILTALQMDISFLEKNIINRNRKINPQIIKKKFSGIVELLNSTIDIIREISTNLRPAILDSFGLIFTIEWYLKEFQKKSGIVCNFISEVKKIKLNPHISIVAYRILQEALTNIIRHSQATLVEVRFKKSQSKIILEIKDNGIGISNDALQNVNSLGLSGMRERALSINGDVIFSVLPLNDPLATGGIPGKGTMVVLSIPINVSKND